MTWSFSDTRQFRKCQRQWYFKKYVANAKSRDQHRREAYYLSKLQSVAAWRGSLVDEVISDYIIPNLNRKRLLQRSEIQKIARELFSQQFEFAKQRRIREPGMTQKVAGTAFAALYPFEYGEEITADDLDQAWNDIETALTNFLEMDEIIKTLQQANYLVTQRALNFNIDAIPVRTVPDLIVFFSNKAPMIIDWKVHSYAMLNYRLQLASYATALTRCKPHKDFPSSLSRWIPTEIRLIEAQLLTRVPRYYTLTDNDIEGVLSFITRTAREMALAVDIDAADVLTPSDFPVALNSEECQRCSFRSLCWETL